ncbi:uncharacterized protein VTP21DRAFT_8412 [Calcarisporiella thermophila]|uniref:uncharacterized protein n=1 Tax=Calcarisporiella thermophila TaxID=911321 RepID=UPI0037444D74
MPRVVSSSTVVTSDDVNKSLQQQQQQKLCVYYCLCSEFILVIDKDLRALPKRKTDHALIVDNNRRHYKLSGVTDQKSVVLLKRTNGFEKQFRFHCARCSLPIAYELTEKTRGGQYTYLIDGSLCETQGRVPEGALGEEKDIRSREENEGEKSAAAT